MCGSSSSLRFALCSQLVGGHCWQCRYAAGYVTRLNSSWLQAVLSLSMARASAEATHVNLRRRRSSSSPLAALCTVRGGGDGWHCQPAARCVIRIDGLTLQAMLLPSMVVASEEAAGAALRRRCALLRALNSTAAGLLATPIRRSRRDETRRLVAAGGTLAVDEGSVCRGYPMARHCRRWQLYVHDSSAALACVANPPHIAC